MNILSAFVNTPELNNMLLCSLTELQSARGKSKYLGVYHMNQQSLQFKGITNGC